MINGTFTNKKPRTRGM